MYEWPVIHPTSAEHQYTSSSGLRSNTYLWVADAPVRYPPVVCRIPFGFAVDPEVYRMNNGCLGSSCSDGPSASPASQISSYQTSRPSCISQSAPVDLTTTMCSRVSRSPITLSTCALIGAVLPLRRAPSTVISALASENSIRSRTESAEKPPN